jgi:hypothetical protein
MRQQFALILTCSLLLIMLPSCSDMKQGRDRSAQSDDATAGSGGSSGNTKKAKQKGEQATSSSPDDTEDKGNSETDADSPAVSDAKLAANDTSPPEDDSQDAADDVVSTETSANTSTSEEVSTTETSTATMTSTSTSTSTGQTANWKGVKAIAERSCSGAGCHSEYVQEATWRAERRQIRREINRDRMPRAPQTLTPAERQLLLQYLESL